MEGGLACLDDWAAAEIVCKQVNVQGGAHEHDTQVGHAGQHHAQQDQHEIRKLVPLMHLNETKSEPQSQAG